MKISYLVTCSTETESLEKLLNAIHLVLGNDQLLILSDKTTLSKETTEIINPFFDVTNAGWYNHPLDNNYGAHKNFGIEKCIGDFIFQIDGDEFPSESLLGDNLHALIESNPTIEAYAVPRINDFKGVNETHARQWGWRLSISPTYKRPIVNWPDYQFRIFKKDYPRISFLRRLHEKIEGYMSYVTLPPEEEYALYHDKTIEKQVETNIRYNKAFTEEENRGHNVFGNKISGSK